jgi:hypothetical protein
MAKKAPAKKAPAKRKPRPKKPVDGIELSELSDETKKRLAEILDAKNEPPKSIAWRSWLVSGAKAAALIVAGAVAGVYAAGGIPIGPGPVVRNDVLQQSYDADRISQIAVLRDLAKQPFDGTTDDGRKQAEAWFNVQRFRSRPVDYKPYTDAVAEAINSNSEGKLAEQFEAK